MADSTAHLEGVIAELREQLKESRTERDFGVQEQRRLHNAVSEDRKRIRDLEKRLEKAVIFKNYVHERLDALGVPKEVDWSSHTAEGCRIGGRIDWIRRELLELGIARSGREAFWHLTDDQVREQLRLADIAIPPERQLGVTVVDGTGETGRAPADIGEGLAYARSEAERTLNIKLGHAMELEERQAIAAAIANAIGIYDAAHRDGHHG